MAFPFGWNPPSLAEFITACCNSDHDCELVVADYEVEGSFGKIKPKILTRNLDGHEYHVVLPNDPEDVLLALPYVASLCRRLHVPTEVFGFKFDDEEGVVDIEGSQSH